MGLENNMINSLDRRNPGEHPVIQKMHEKAVETLSGDAINPRDFSDIYSKEVIDKDLAYVERLKAKFENDETKKAAEVLEAIIYLNSEMSIWLGMTAETIRPSEYDDYVNGIDLITEFSNDDVTRHLALGVDITFGSQTLGKKFDRIKEEIDNDELAQVKYFESHGFKGRLQQLPRIVIGVEKDMVVELAGLWMNNKQDDLVNHPAKQIILTEIIEQLDVYSKYAERHNKLGALKSYNQALGIVRTLKKLLKGTTPEMKKRISEDRVCKNMREDLAFKFSK